jgi:hypothetical protein
MTPAERRAASPRFPWSDLALSPIDGLLASVPAVTFVGLPLYLALWLAGDGAPERWAGFVVVSAFAFGVGRTLFTSLRAFLRHRARVDDDLLDDEVEERVVEVNEAIGIVIDPPAMYVRFVDGDSVTLRGDYVTALRQRDDFPSTWIRLVQLPQSRVVVAVEPRGEPLLAAFVSGRDHTPTELDGQPATIDFDRLRALAT